MGEKPCKNSVENDKKSSVQPCQVEEREKSLKKFLKKYLNQSKYFFKKTWNTIFDWSNLFFDQPKIMNPVFLKTVFLTNSTYFFKTFSTFSLSLSPTWQGSTKIFCRFLSKFLQGFPPSRPVRPFYPSFCSYFRVFMHLKGIFGPF